MSKAKMCEFCKRPYLRPCDVKKKESCPNWLHLGRAAPKKVKKK